jgi:hypothetical protein
MFRGTCLELCEVFLGKQYLDGAQISRGVETPDELSPSELALRPALTLERIVAPVARFGDQIELVSDGQ